MLKTQLHEEEWRRRGSFHLVPRKRVEVYPEAFDVHLPMRRVCNPIDAQHRARHCMHCVRNAPDIVDRAEDVTRMRTRHQFCLVAQQRSQILRRELQIARLGRRRPPFEGQVSDLGEADPGGDVGLVIDGGDYDFGVGGKREGEGLGEVGEELGC